MWTTNARKTGRPHDGIGRASVQSVESKWDKTRDEETGRCNAMQCDAVSLPLVAHICEFSLLSLLSCCHARKKKKVMGDADNR